jgi:hypothetical protein
LPVAPAPAPAPVAARPIPVLGGTEYALPASILTALDSVPARPVYGDAVCQQDGSPLFYRWPVVRAARGYPEGSQKGVLLVCVRCLTPLNPGELLEFARDQHAVS